MTETSLEDRWNNTIEFALHHFENQIVERYTQDCSSFDGQTIEWSYIESVERKYEVIINEEEIGLDSGAYSLVVF